MNETSIYVETDRSIAQELSEFFSFYVPGYKFMPAYRNKVWDGKIRLFNVNNCELPYGLMTYVMNFALKRDYEFEAEPELTKTHRFEDDFIMNFRAEICASAKSITCI